MTKDFDPDALRQSFTMVGTDYAAPSPTNPRKSFPEAAMAELTESIKKHGVLQPIIVRMWPLAYPQPLPTTTYEIVAGERRWRAAKAAGLTMLEAKVRELTDLEVLEIQIIENLQREDLHPLEEAEGYGLIMSRHQYTAEQLGEKIGKSRSYIFGRLKLLALDEDARRLFRGGLLNPSTALLVARIPTAGLRAKAIKEITERTHDNEPMSVRAAQRLIQQRFMLRLAEAPYPLGDATLTKAGSCEPCPKRTGNVLDLFDDVDSPDVCTDPDCFAEKKQAFITREAEHIVAAGGKAIIGKEAAKIAPYGIDKWTPLEGYTQLTKTCTADAERRTYLEILGDDIDQVMIEDARHGVMVPTLPNHIIAEKLQAAGIELQGSNDPMAKAKTDGKILIERAFRARLFEQVREAAGAYADDNGAGFAYGAQDQLFKMAIARLWERAEQDLRFRIANQWEAVGENNTARAAAFGLGLHNLTTPQRWLLLVDLLTINGTQVANEWDIEHGGKALTEMAKTVFGIDPKDTRQLVEAEQKAKPETIKTGKKTPATAKKTAKPAPTAPLVEAPYPLKAAQAGELTRENAAQASDESAESETATAKSETPPASAGLIEMDEKPSEDEADPFYSQAVDVVQKNQRASISLVQRSLRIGYNRAARLIESMEKDNLVSRMDGNGNRTVLPAKKDQSSAAGAENEKPPETIPGALKIGDCVKVRSTCKNWRMADGEAIIETVVRPGLYRATYGPLICDVAALVESEIAEVLPAGHVPAWANKSESSDSDESDETPAHHQPAFKVDETIQVRPDAERDGIPMTHRGRIGEINAIYNNGDIEVDFGGGDKALFPSEALMYPAASDRCDKTVDMFQGESA